MTQNRRHLARFACAGASVALAASVWLTTETPGPTWSAVSPADARTEALAPNEVGAPAEAHERSSEASKDPKALSPLDEPVYSAELLRLRARAQAKLLGPTRIIEDRLGRIGPPDRRGRHSRATNGNALGSFVPVENEAALDHFHSALERLRSEPNERHKVRIAVYGASHTQADIYASYLRYYLQSRFGNGGAGFVPVGLEKRWSRRLGYRVRSSALRVEYAQQRSPLNHGRLGLSGSAGVSRAGGATEIFPKEDEQTDLHASHFQVFFGARPKGGDLEVRVDGESLVHLSARADRPEPRYYEFERPLDWHKIQLRSRGGPVRLYGLVAERPEAGVVIDTLGIRGTRAANMLLWDLPLWADHLRHRNPDLVMFAYGTNETTDRGQPIEDYSADLREVLKRLRAALPAASCVLVGPGDFPKGRGRHWEPRPRLLQIIRAQREIAPEFGCGFFDTYEFMGGTGSMHEWTRARPPMGSSDHIHFTRRGYVRLGMALGDALMRGYDARHVKPEDRVISQREASLARESKVTASVK